MLQDIFAYRTQNSQTLKILHNLLNIDQSYTNTFNKATRKASYQEKVLQSLREFDCMVYRASIRFPYIFRFRAKIEELNQKEQKEQKDEKDETNEINEMNRINRINGSNGAIQLSNQSTRPSSTNTPSNYLEFDFSGQNDLIPILHNFLEHLDSVLDNYSVLSSTTLLNELLERTTIICALIKSPPKPNREVQRVDQSIGAHKLFRPDHICRRFGSRFNRICHHRKNQKNAFGISA
ncbi:MAG: hypothetical protein K9W44_06650 [Candidatus Lokiarchaeota archaeon]|nr:hypothetical protein [Candidatus Harpocratesius repetitus]